MEDCHTNKSVWAAASQVLENCRILVVMANILFKATIRIAIQNIVTLTGKNNI